jgi:hypothetical protein
VPYPLVSLRYDSVHLEYAAVVQLAQDPVFASLVASQSLFIVCSLRVANDPMLNSGLRVRPWHIISGVL